MVRESKPRLISAAPFRDRVVHHALCSVISPIFERSFIANTFASLEGRGTHRAVANYEGLRDRFRHVLRCDIYRYFPAIDHDVLKRDLRRRIACPDTLWLCDTLIDGSNLQEPVDCYFPDDDLFTPYARRRGLPIGNLTSQLFGNVYLNPLDHYVTEILRAPYLRYLDDFALFADDQQTLTDWRTRIAAFLEHGVCCCIHTRPEFCWRRSQRFVPGLCPQAGATSPIA
jgi:retron-type reverse transcriptase